MKHFLVITGFILGLVWILNTSCKPSRVIDGDTIEISSLWGTERIRLADIDAPELGTPEGEAARLFLWKAIWNEDIDVERLRFGYYGRTIARVKVGGMDVSKMMLRYGHAKKYSYSYGGVSKN